MPTSIKVVSGRRADTTEDWYANVTISAEVSFAQGKEELERELRALKTPRELRQGTMFWRLYFPSCWKDADKVEFDSLFHHVIASRRRDSDVGWAEW